MSKIDFLKTIYTKFIDENSTVLSIGLLSNDDKIVLNQAISNEEHNKIIAQLENQCKNCKQYINNNKHALIPCGHTKFCNSCINILTRTKKCLQCGAHVDNILELH